MLTMDEISLIHLHGGIESVDDVIKDLSRAPGDEMLLFSRKRKWEQR